MDDLSDSFGEQVTDERRESTENEFPNVLYWAATIPGLYILYEMGIKLGELGDYLF